MNSLSILSSRVDKVIGSTPPPTPQNESFPSLRPSSRSRRYESAIDETEDQRQDVVGADPIVQEKGKPVRHPATVGQRLYMAVLSPCFNAVKWILFPFTASTNWLVSYVYDDRGVFSPLLPLKQATAFAFRPFGHRVEERPKNSMSGVTSDCDYGTMGIYNEKDSSNPDFLETVPTRGHRRSSSFSSDTNESTGEEIAPRRSIRIRLYNEGSVQKPKSSSVKSPTSSSSSLRLTKYPRSAGPPQPLLPRHPSTKTLILDLDETLIHSLAKGGRMTSGHMVEVKLDRQHAILYYVHKRPYCDEFLRRVCRWYDLVVFTASVQEYADPVIDWLEQDRKYFKGRYYRQHCTNRNGAYIKDITTVEPDLSKVMIIDNSPMSYIFHEDNAIPIEGWINDPTDIDLLHLIPLLQALQYAADVRALLALRMGEAFG